LNLRGCRLSESDYNALAARWIDREAADRAMFRRVTSIEGGEIVGRNGGGDYAGIAIPYCWPSEERVREYRIRRDRPDVDPRGKLLGKYLSPPGRGSLLYIPVGVETAWLDDVTLPAVISEGEFKAVALMSCAWHRRGESAERPAFLAMSLPGAWNWRGTVGKANDEDGNRVNVKGPIPDLARIEWNGRQVTIVFDRDAATNDSVLAARNGLAVELQSRGAIVKIFAWPKAHGDAKGIDDLLACAGPDYVLPLIEKAKKFKQTARATVTGDWRDRLIKGPKGEPKSLLANAMLALREAPEWEGVLKHDSFALQTIAQKPTPWGFTGKWSDQQDSLACEWLHHRGISVNLLVASAAVEAVAHQAEFHPVRDYLDSLQWDGVNRIDQWLTAYLGVEDSDYSRAVGAKWLISAIARIRKPGVKADCLLILEGPQGLGKSSALRILGEPWFADEVADLGSKDASLQVAGVWILELAELDAMGRADSSRVKAFLSRMTDRFRPPYGRRLVEVPRQSIFAGSVNGSNYLKDETGARRFWPVACGSINLPALIRDRNQLWAEAQKRFSDGETWWLEGALSEAATEEQAARYEGDPWDSTILAWAEGRDEISIEQVLGHCLNKSAANWAQGDKNRVARCLKAKGFERFNKRIGQGREWRYRQPR
jgi:hypothetical protein